MRRVAESDVCIIGSGITAAMVADVLAARTHAKIVVVEAGDETVPLEERPARRARFLRYGETPWGKDHIDGFEIDGPLQSRSMQVGGLAMHWAGKTPRFSPEDFKQRSLFGVGTDWPISYEDLDPFYQQAEELIGVAGEQGPPDVDPRAKPYPLPALPLSYNLTLLRNWAHRAGVAVWSQPEAKNSIAYRGRPQCCRNDTCVPICPIGAKYSPDFTWNALRRANRIRLVTRTFIRQLVLDPRTRRISHAIAVNRDALQTPVELHAKQFVVAGGYVWSSHLLLLSAQHGAEAGVANGSGLVGKYLTGHRAVHAQIELPLRLYPGMNTSHALVTKQFMGSPEGKYVRHYLSMGESAVDRGARLVDDRGTVMLGDEILRDWRRRTQTGVAFVSAPYEVIPDRSSELTLDATRTTPWGDRLPKLSFRDAPESVELRAHTEDTIRGRFAELATVGDGRVLHTSVSAFQDHPAGGCRMGDDPAQSVVDRWGRAHDHENLFIAGAPTSVSGSCANATLTFCALALRTAAEMARELAPSRTEDSRR
jgi:choline dehydrogenase-like flavoprotein